MDAAASSGVRLAELVATISLGTDLGLGQSMEHILRQTLVSLRMAELLAFDEAEREVANFSGLLEAAAALRTQVRQGRLDADVVQAVLEAAGHRARRRRELPAGLTAREVEVLRLLTRGLSNRDIAEKLTISRKTAGSHIEHIYTKTGVRNRAGASLFAMRHGLMIE